jgi:hypothetical protein
MQTMTSSFVLEKNAVPRRVSKEAVPDYEQLRKRCCMNSRKIKRLAVAQEQSAGLAGKALA